jgi:transcriptional regulator with AAA-type ATPase domain
MSASAAAGEPARALVAYETLRERLAEELGADLSPQTRELHLALLRQQDRDRADRHPAPARSVHPDRSARPGRSVRPDRRRRVLAGRDREAGALREAWDPAVAGGSGLVMIIGEAGIGKTALAEDLAADADQDGATVLRTRCYEAERSLFLQPIAEAIAPVVSRMPASALR